MQSGFDPSLVTIFWDTLFLSPLETALTSRMDLEHIQPSPCPDHQVEVDPAGVPAHIELPQPLALHPGGHLLQQMAHCLKAKTAPEGNDICSQLRK